MCRLGVSRLFASRIERRSCLLLGQDARNPSCCRGGILALTPRGACRPSFSASLRLKKSVSRCCYNRSFPETAIWETWHYPLLSGQSLPAFSLARVFWFLK